MRFIIASLCLFFAGSVLSAQNIDALKKQLQSASSTAEKIQLNYQLGEAYRGSNLRDNGKEALKYAKAAHELSKSRNVGMAARSAFLVGQIYKDERDKRNQEVWFRTAESFAKQAKDSDLIVKSVVERGKLATRDRNYRRASQIYEEAFAYFSKKGTSISELESQFEQEKAILEREKQKLEEERGRLQSEINNLSSEKDELVANQGELIRQKEQVEAEITTKNEELETVEEARQQAVEVAAQKEREAKALSREKLEQEYLKEQAEMERMKAEMAREKAQRVAQRSKELTYLTLILAGFLVALALLTYARFSAKRKANKKLEEQNEIIKTERQRSDDLLLNILPSSIAAELKEKGKAGSKKI